MIARNQPLAVPDIADDVAMGLTRRPKSLPPKLFYDAAGSALFEEITRLPEYYLTRTERAILEACAEEIAACAPPGANVIELGAGSASKTQILLAALLRLRRRTHFYPVDISRAALAEAMRNLRLRLPSLPVTPVVADYSGDSARLRQVPGPKLVLYLGSSIGNFEPMQAGELLRSVRSAMGKGDALLLGADLAKDESLLLAAYDDAQGVTARFNKNVLARINRELGGHFDVDAFRHLALWNPRCSRMEMYLESRCRQSVPIDLLGLSIPFSAGERIHTENSYKFTARMIASILQLGGFELERSWTDHARWFTLCLARA